MRGTWVLRGGKIVRKGGPEDIRPQVARSALPRPMVISDYVDVDSPVSGERFTSKSELRRHYRANDVRELGNETIKPRDNDTDVAPGIERDLANAMLSLGG